MNKIILLRIVLCILQPSAAKQLCDLDSNKENRDIHDKKDGPFGLKMDQYAKKSLQVWMTCVPCKAKRQYAYFVSR